MSDPFKPSVGLLAKLGSIAQHIDEVSGEAGHAFDWVAIRSLLADQEVGSWLDKMDKRGLLPVRRHSALSASAEQDTLQPDPVERGQAFTARQQEGET